MTRPAADIEVLDKRATYAEAKKLGRLPSLEQFVFALREHSFISESRGSWYWLRDTDLPEEGYQRIDSERGER